MFNFYHDEPWRNGYENCSRRRYNSQHTDRMRKGFSQWFGVRRPLRYLINSLDLDESQAQKLASVMNRLKTEKEQQNIDKKRSVQGIAELLDKDQISIEDSRKILAPRLEAYEKLNEEIARAIVEIFDVLDKEQREDFKSMLLSGAFQI